MQSQRRGIYSLNSSPAMANEKQIELARKLKQQALKQTGTASKPPTEKQSK